MSLSVEEEQTFLSLIAEERIQQELDGATPKEKALCITLLLNLLYFQSMFSVYITYPNIWTVIQNQCIVKNK